MQGFETTGISKFKDKGDNTEMALRTIRTEGDSVLEKICRPVEKIDKRTKDRAGDNSWASGAAHGQNRLLLFQDNGRRHAGNHV